ncbi:MAG TPA: FAD:protein FMN transferase [Solirubrobacteraceae bacterium]|nr:FAD:protein FMN transferase [Solirubrobacteraceae bacterium]
MSGAVDISFRSMGSDVRLIIEAPLARGLPAPHAAAEAERRYVEDYARRLSRFRADSELSALNEDPATEVAASILLRTAVAAGLWAAERSDGLVDPTLVREIEAAGYRTSQEGSTPASLQAALAAAPPRRPARPRAPARWRQVEVDQRRGTIRRPPGLRIDTGGTGKGLAADAVAHRLRFYSRFVVDCGGDLAVGGVGAQLQPVPIEVEHPLTGECVHTLHLAQGGVATSGLNVRIWQQGDGSFAHHLLDPSSGEPVWSGLVGATALAPTALEAETLSKIALLSGPEGARQALAEHGGLVVHDDGDVELIGPLGQDGAGAGRPMARAA